MKQASKRLVLTLVLLGVATSVELNVSGSARQDSMPREAMLKTFYSQLTTLFKRSYPKATSHLLGAKIHFEQDTRVFIIHEPLKTGEWQDPHETRGPMRGGILCDIEWRKGEYNGQAMVPQTFDKRYFKRLVMAPSSRKLDAHLYVHLSYPDGVSADFLKQFAELVDGFER